MKKNYFWFPVLMLLVFVCFQTLEAKTLSENDTFDGEFYHYTVVVKDKGLSYLAKKMNISTAQLLVWNPWLKESGGELIKPDMDIRYKTPEMLQAESDQKILRQVKKAEKVFEEKNALFEQRISSVALKSDITSTELSIKDLKGKSLYFIFSILAGFLLIGFFFVRLLRSRRVIEEAVKKVEAKIDSVSCVVKVGDYSYRFTPINIEGKMLKPYLKDGKLQKAWFVNMDGRNGLEGSLKATLRKNPEIFDIIKNDPGNLGKIERKLIQNCREKNAGS